jgi:hypothetical protein
MNDQGGDAIGDYFEQSLSHGFVPSELGGRRHAIELTGPVLLDLNCGGATLADTGFQTLCSLLPDTNIDVTHAA